MCDRERSSANDLNDPCEITKPLAQSDDVELLHHHRPACELAKCSEKEQRGHTDAHDPQKYLGLGHGTTPALILAEAIERLRVRAIVAAHSSDQAARSLANIDGIVERARSYGGSWLRSVRQGY